MSDVFATDVNSATGLPMMGGFTDSKRDNSFGLDRDSYEPTKNNKKEIEFNDFIALVVAPILGIGLLVYSYYGKEIDSILKWLF